MSRRRARPQRHLPLVLVSAWLVVACRPSQTTQTPQPPPTAVVDPATIELEQRLAYLEQQLEDARVEAHVPGMAIAIVKDDAVIFAKGFGVSDLDANTPVTPETVFAIGSSTKAFSSTLAAMMVDEGKLAWDDPASKHLPGFELQVDGEQGEVATVRDLFAHRTGFARMSVLWAGNTLPRDRILAYASRAKPVAKLRAEFHYNNVTYMAGALAAASAGGSSWEELLRTRLLEPLGMTHTSIDYAGAKADPARAQGYTWRDDLGNFEPATLRNTDAIAPAGAIFSSVLDMSNWLRLQLGEGDFQGQRLVGAASLQATQTQQIEITDGVGYGMGWMLREWNGKRVVEHGGNIDGYAASVALLPEEELGMVLLTNAGLTPLQGTAMNLVFDALLTDAYLADVAAASGGEDLSRFVGEYVAELPGFGGKNFVVSVEDGKLAVDVPGQTKYLLRPPDPEDDEALREFEATDSIAISFVEGPDGAATSLLLHQNGMKIELLRAGFEPEPEVDVSEVQALLGSYRHDDGMVVEVVIHHGRLALDVPGQMIYGLEPPDEKADYHFRANYDFVVRFTRDASDKVETMSLVQPGFSGVFVPEKRAETITSEALHRRRKSDKRAKALAKAGIIHLRQTAELPSAGVVGTTEAWFDASGRLRETAQIGEQGEVGRSLAILVDGGGWAESSFEPRKATTGIELQQAQLGHPCVLLGDWRSHYDGETVLRSIEGEDGRELYVVELSKEGLPPATIHVDAKTGDVVEFRQVQIAGNGLRIPVVVELSDYRSIAGLRIPFRSESRNPHSGSMIVTVLEVETKVAEDPARFVTMPAPRESP